MADQIDALPSVIIDRSIPVPFYFQLAAALRDQIVGGHWRPHQRLMSEPSLCEHFEVSRSTVRQALQVLASEGLISRERGRGTFIAEAKNRSWMLQSFEGFDVDRMGRAVSTRILSAAREDLPDWACKRLQLSEGSEGMALARLRSVDDQVALYVVNYLPLAFEETVLGLDEHSSLYGALELEHGLRVFGGQRSVEAVLAGERLGELLEVDVSTPVACIEATSWDRDLQPFDCYRAWLRTDRLRIEVDIGEPEVDRGSAQRAEATTSTASAKPLRPLSGASRE